MVSFGLVLFSCLFLVFMICSFHIVETYLSLVCYRLIVLTVDHIAITMCTFFLFFF